MLLENAVSVAAFLLPISYSKNIEFSKTIFQDDFSTLDLSKWKHEKTLSGGGNWEFQYYQSYPENSYVRDNTLFLKPTYLSDMYGEEFLSSGRIDVDGCTDDRDYGCSRTGTYDNYLNPIVSAKLTTVDTFAFTYGKVSFEAKMPRGDWLWPAVWMMPRDYVYGGWPASGEIDIVESRGNNQPGYNECASSTLHWGPNTYNNRFSWTTGEMCIGWQGTDFADDFHKWELEWTDQYIKTSIDGQTIFYTSPEPSFWEWGSFGNEWNPGWYSKMAPFDQEFYIIINLAVGGTNGFFPDGQNNGKPWSNSSPYGPKEFWNGKWQWENSWDLTGEKSALQIRNLKVESV